MSEASQPYALYAAGAVALFFPLLVLWLAIHRKAKKYRAYQETKESLVQHLRDKGGPLSARQIATNLRMKRFWTRSLLKKLVREGRLQRLDRPGCTDRVLYQLPEQQMERTS